MLYTVEKGTEVVIYRLGKYHRIEGPGNILLAPRLDAVHHELDIREQTYDISITDIIVNGIRVELRLQFSACLNIRKCTSNRDRQGTLAGWDAWQRRMNVEGRAWRATTQSLANYEQMHPVSPDATDYTKLKHLIPNPIPNARLHENLQQALKEDLCTIGFVLNQTEPIRLLLAHPSPPPEPDSTLGRTAPDRVVEARYDLPATSLLTEVEVDPIKVIDQLPPNPLANTSR